MEAIYRTTGIIFFLLLFYLLPSYCQVKETQRADYNVIEELDVKVEMRDGVRLSTNIYRPDAPGRFPVLLTRTPYGNGGKGNRFALYFVSRGYAVVAQDTRGRYESEGVFDALQAEAPDGYDTQQWIGKQSWSNGKIGTYGGSYVGFTQWISAPLQSPYLVTMMPSVTFTDFHNEVYQNGAFRLELWGLWSYPNLQLGVVNSLIIGTFILLVLIFG